MRRAATALAAAAAALAAAALCVACYNPTYPTGLRCADGNECPPGQDCMSGVCGQAPDPDADPGRPDADPTRPDADPTTPDAEPGSPDAPEKVCSYNVTEEPIAVMLILDSSGSMIDQQPFGVPRSQAMRNALLDADGLVSRYESFIHFGACAQPQFTPCPMLQIVDPAVMQRTQIEMFANSFGTDGPPFPNPDLIAGCSQAFGAATPQRRAIIEMFDSNPSNCAGMSGGDPTAAAAAAAATDALATWNASTYLITLTNLANDPSDFYMQTVADAGAGVPNAEFWRVSTTVLDLKVALEEVMRTIRGCSLTLETAVTAGQAAGGTVTINGTMIVPSNEWSVDGDQLTLLGPSCDNYLLNLPPPTVEATFPCE